MKNTKGYYTEKIINKFTEALKIAVEAVKAGDLRQVSISNGNTKMGTVASVSLLPFLSCPGRCANTCGSACYAAKLANLRPNVLQSYANNQALAMYNPDLFWAQVNVAVMAVRYFRFHVSGDILNADYFRRMMEVARNNSRTEILVFTKRYEVVNAWIDENGELPENVHILFSGWNNLQTINPHNLPETNVFTTEDEVQDNWKICGGNCFECGCRGVGCWQAQKGDVIAFKKH